MTVHRLCNCNCTTATTCWIVHLHHTALCRYDQGGFKNLQGCDFEVDLSSAGLFNTAVIAVFSKLGAHSCSQRIADGGNQIFMCT